MASNNINHVVIVGGGSAGWMTAAMLAKLFTDKFSITLIESDDIGTIGVGEATIPPIKTFNDVLGIDESQFMVTTQATFKLGIQFENWGKLGDSYMHAFGNIGRDIGLTPFHQFFLKEQQKDANLCLWDYSFNYQTAKQNKFIKMAKIEATPLQGIAYAYHFDASSYATYLKTYSQQLGVKRIEGKVTTTKVNAKNGFVESVTLQSGQTICGDLFIDCSGFQGLLIEQALKTGFDDWSHYLPCDRAIAVQTENSDIVRPYTRSIAHDAGWQWQIPLQHRTGNGHVYCSKFIDDEQALATLLANVEGKLLTKPKFIKFTTGKRKKLWNKNCVAIGLSSGFLEPLESTSLHLIQSSIVRLIKLFPDLNFNQADIDEYNMQADREFIQVRDFIILHYKATQRNDSQFWQHCQNMPIPDSLQHKIELFKSQGRIFRTQDDLFSEAAWLQVLLGQNIKPESYHPIADQLTDQQVQKYLSDLKTIFTNHASKIPSHQAFIGEYCPAKKSSIG